MDSIYRSHILEHARHPHNFGILADATHTARLANPTCGDACTIYLKIENDVIVDAKWDGHGCALSTAASSLLTEHLTQKPGLSRASGTMQLSPRHGGGGGGFTSETEFLKLLGIEPTSGRLDCALLPLRAYHAAIK
jgi:nitrogen fixation NifU-like protein